MTDGKNALVLRGQDLRGSTVLARRAYGSPHRTDPGSEDHRDGGHDNRHSGRGSSPKASSYTGAAYVVTVALLIVAVSVIFLFTFFVSVVKDLSFRRLFLEIASLRPSCPS